MSMIRDKALAEVAERVMRLCRDTPGPAPGCGIPGCTSPAWQRGGSRRCIAHHFGLPPEGVPDAAVHRENGAPDSDRHGEPPPYRKPCRRCRRPFDPGERRHMAKYCNACRSKAYRLVARRCVRRARREAGLRARQERREQRQRLEQMKRYAAAVADGFERACRRAALVAAIVRLRRQGVPAADIAAQYGRSRGWVYWLSSGARRESGG